MFKKIYKYTFITLCFILMTTGLLACSSKNPVDALKLDKDFEGKSFTKDGIAEVKVASISDGDTALFRTGNISYNVRFYGINTPESTWQIEKWGKTASNFTKDKLNNAESIIIEGSTTPPEKETNGRWLGFVWYQPKDSDRYYNLNLELVRNGFSTSSVDPDHEYFDYFEDAAKLAEKEELAIYSSEPDDNFDETLEEVTLKEIVANPSSFDQSYVKVKCTIIERDGSDVLIGDIIDGTLYTFPVYLGYGSLGDDRICRVGNRSQFVGRINSHDGDWQLTGIEKKLGVEDTTKVLLEGYELTFGTKEVSSHYNYNNIVVTEVIDNGDTYLIKGTTSNNKYNNINVNLTVKKEFIKTEIKVGNTIKGTAYNLTSNNITSDNMENIDIQIISEKDIIIK